MYFNDNDISLFQYFSVKTIVKCYAYAILTLFLKFYLLTFRTIFMPLTSLEPSLVPSGCKGMVSFGKFPLGGAQGGLKIPLSPRFFVQITPRNCLVHAKFTQSRWIPDLFVTQ